ncbi:unnamed protein product [Phaedon cochleariae]|uniref:Major facilitator superfamily (MFS) profile domain-containing protein n=1 Tax=Phaedon cochleariae TaxID=80249 RepID=A0A9N9SM74_PHACE|nr:unnamed protein product [Phaedon cochleariae]
MKINHKLLPIKAHFFFFMAAMGPILPQLPVFGRELGISSLVMGTITGILPIVFLFAKPLFGLIVDVYREYRKTIFMLVITVMGVCFALLNFVPPQPKVEVNFTAADSTAFTKCMDTDITDRDLCSNLTIRLICNSKCFRQPEMFIMNSVNSSNSSYCYFGNNSIANTTSSKLPCDINCEKDIDYDSQCLYKSISFWGFVILMSLGSIGFNVVNSISDAICFEVIGDDFDYGKQRVWGTVGFGVSALIAGYAVDFFSGNAMKYSPAIVVMMACCTIDLFACIKLKLPIMEAPDNIFKSIKDLLKNKHVATFLTFSVFAGIVDSFIIYYLFWYLEDLAEATGTKNVKLLEGLIVAAETLGGEVIFFSISGKILERFGHVHCFSMCFINYALRLGLISIVPSPWWIVPIEFIFQGPTYALTYTTIVAYANELAPPGASATMQGIAAGMDDGFGYAIGSFIGGILYNYMGGRNAMQVFSLLGVLCSIVHLLLHKTVLRQRETDKSNGHIEYKPPDLAIKITDNQIA